MSLPLRRTTTVGPLRVQFANVNRVLGIERHEHYAELRLVFLTLGRLGFPIFEDTVASLQAMATEATRDTFEDATNEDVALHLWGVFEGLQPKWMDTLERYGGDYMLCGLQLDVMGVSDHIGHAPGMATYRITR